MLRTVVRPILIAGAMLALVSPVTTGAQAGAQRGAPVVSSRTPPTPPSLEGAPLAYMVDLGSGRVLFSREADRRFMPASLTKLMTAYTAFEMLDEGTLQLAQRMPVSDAAFKEWSGKGSSMFVARGTAIPVDTLLKGILTVSANDGCVVLAEGAAGSVPNWVDLMNAKARELGMKDSHFGTPNGWPDQGRTYTSARDLATLARAIITRHPGKYERYFGIRLFEWNRIQQHNRNPILDAVEGADGLKTGFTNEAGYGFVGSAERNGRRLVMVIGGTESGQARKAIARDFINWGFDDWHARMLFGANQPVANVELQGGAERSLEVASTRPIFVTAPNGQAAEAKVAVRYLGPAQAPIAKGQKVASLTIRTPDGVKSEVPLVATHDVAVANWWQRMRNGLLSLVT
ncbi:D-alanyl-D-alanine carboxypeptidase family protein [Croceicoccus sp. BE223]|uniref:D-alanyl-D-alanine carboxypeptidase family protein n=1 Tax=Croceicoccus sp. BE223 TaxID=2817716 RepID=UPI002859F62A|nr:D-alanyl-D-alanine carboxypeptidase family protein [Croceicoccus sp. BE223]MDR7103240.1 D-alanyl-D-alanine carboxypeptidase (penicillin-binding protein 5/6) [Croceicoccus sp. BE223]